MRYSSVAAKNIGVSFFLVVVSFGVLVLGWEYLFYRILPMLCDEILAVKFSAKTE